MLSRRAFIGAAGGVAGTAAAGGGIWAGLLRDSVEESLSPGIAATTTSAAATTTARPAGSGGGRVLVVLEMAGGNDALNTLVPSVGAYRDSRSVLALPEADLIALARTDYSLHPALAPLVPYWAAGSMLAVAGVGMTQQSRSHFKAMDAWWAGVPGAPSTTGWLGRWLDATLDTENDPLRAIALGGGSPALVGERSLATVVRNPGNFQLRTPPGTDAEALISAFLDTAAPLASSPHLAAAQSAIPSAVDAVELLASVSDTNEAGDVFDAMPGRGAGSASELLQTAARIIDLEIGTRVITVGISGFDTHADQLPRHQDLLTDIGGGLAAFFERLAADGHSEKVMVITTSEFGRRVVENGSGGTDHGNGGLQFVFGPTIAGGQVVGDFDLANLDNGDLAAAIDTRSVYAAAIEWLDGTGSGPPPDAVLPGGYDDLQLLVA